MRFVELIYNCYLLLHVLGSGVTVGLPAQHVVAADEADHPHPVQNVLIDHTLKTHLHAPLIKIPLDRATKSPLRGKMIFR